MFETASVYENYEQDPPLAAASGKEPWIADMLSSEFPGFGQVSCL